MRIYETILEIVGKIKEVGLRICHVLEHHCVGRQHVLW